MPRPPLLSVVIPCYNERATVAELLRRVREVPVEKEIIVIDDRSTDGSRDVVAALAQQWPEIRHILQPVNQGKGAAIQRPLWASTSTKDPSYHDVFYAESLIGRDSIITMPEQTIRAFEDHGEVTPNALEQGVEEAARTIQDLADAGIDLHCVAWQLEHEGIKQFTDAFDRAHREVEDKRHHAVSKAAAA